MTVLENVLTASPNGICEKSLEKAQYLLKFIELCNLKDEYSENLSYGQQKLLEFLMQTEMGDRWNFFMHLKLFSYVIFLGETLQQVMKLRTFHFSILIIFHHFHKTAQILSISTN